MYIIVYNFKFCIYTLLISLAIPLKLSISHKEKITIIPVASINPVFFIKYRINS
jgi:hypothetical protein